MIKINGIQEFKLMNWDVNILNYIMECFTMILLLLSVCIGGCKNIDRHSDEKDLLILFSHINKQPI